MKLSLQAMVMLLMAAASAMAQDKPAATPAAPAVLPGNGLAQHDFFYAGESRDRKMFIVKKGQLVWSYDDPTGKGEISDAVVLSSGNILFAHQFAVQLITPDKKTLWNYDVPKGCEVHTALPIGNDHVLFIQNGPEPFLRVVNISTNQTEKEFPLQVKNPKNVHVQFRHARLTAAGTVMVAHMDSGKVSEYDSNGKEVWTVPAPGAWGVTPLASGNILVTDNKGWHEIDRDKKTVWEMTKTDLPDYKLPNLQQAWRLPNGNTLINSWFSQWTDKLDPNSVPAQVIEVTPDKKVVWALRTWGEPANLGPATTIQILDTPDVPENVHFGEIK